MCLSIEYICVTDVQLGGEPIVHIIDVPAQAVQ